ncbi:hypothetical protein MKQ70_32825 [Chitinophaga sedimenti]|nr:hypothetical protein [Chitinophaga sedimenti]
MDGDLGLKKYYGLQIPTVVISDAVMYRAMYEGKLDVVSGYSTDGRIRAFDLTILEDDKHIFPHITAHPSYAAKLYSNTRNLPLPCSCSTAASTIRS